MEENGVAAWNDIMTSIGKRESVIRWTVAAGKEAKEFLDHHVTDLVSNETVMPFTHEVRFIARIKKKEYSRYNSNREFVRFSFHTNSKHPKTIRFRVKGHVSNEKNRSSEKLLFEMVLFHKNSLLQRTTHRTLTARIFLQNRIWIQHCLEYLRSRSKDALVSFYSLNFVPNFILNFKLDVLEL